MRYLIRSIRKFIIPALILVLLLTTAITVFCFVTVKSTAVCNRIDFINRKGFIKYASVRAGKKRYLLTHFLATAVCTVLVVMVSYYATLCISLRMTPETLVTENRLFDYVFGEYEVNHPYLFGLAWCFYKGVVATLFVLFGNLLALYTDNLFVSVLGPFVYCMAENLITSLLNLPMYSIMTTYVLNRLSPSCMHVHNYVIGCFTYILITLGIILIIRRRKENVDVRN